MHCVHGVVGVDTHEPNAVAMIGPRPPGRPEPIVDGPQAFLAVLPGQRGPLRTHFHRVDQFQVITHGSAVMQGHPVRRGHVHYSDRFQPYGPIQPDDDGLAFLTLRSLTGGGVFYMPESQPDLASGLKDIPESVSDRRNVTHDITASTGVLRDDPDGLRIEVIEAASDAAITARVGGSGAYVVVVSGSLTIGAEPIGADSIVWLDAGESLDGASGPDGVRIAVLQYPAKARLADSVTS